MEGKRIFAACAGRAGDGFLIESACDGAIVTTREQRSASAIETQRGRRGPRTSAAICRESLRSARGARVAAICRVLSRDCPEGIRPLVRYGMQTADTRETFIPRYRPAINCGRRAITDHDAWMPSGRCSIADTSIYPRLSPPCVSARLVDRNHNLLACSYVSAASPGIPSENGRAALIPLTRKSLRPARKKQQSQENRTRGVRAITSERGKIIHLSVTLAGRKR